MPTVSVTKTVEFEAAHVLPWHRGKCSRLHGHTYRLEVTVTGPVDTNGVVTDFGHVRDTLRDAVLARCDHRLLNDVVDNPTAERLALAMLGWLTEAGLPVTRLRLWETTTSSVTVEP